MPAHVGRVTSEPDLEIGKIVNHTHVLDIPEIRQVVEERVLAQLGEGTVERVEPVHVAPAEDNKLLTKAARAWRDAEGEELEFTDDLGSTKLFWFGLRYELRGPEDQELDEDVPSQWPPEGAEDAGEATVGDRLKDDELEDGFGEITEE
jgi:hypothetical protein